MLKRMHTQELLAAVRIQVLWCCFHQLLVTVSLMLSTLLVLKDMSFRFIQTSKSKLCPCQMIYYCLYNFIK